MLKKLVLSVLFIVIMASCAFADKAYIITVNNTTTDNVKSVLKDTFLQSGYEVKAEEDERIIFLVRAGDGFFTPLQRFSVYCDMTPLGENVKLNVTKKVAQGFLVMDEDITDIAPLIKKAKNLIDGTPTEYIINELEDSTEQQNQPEKPLGIVLNDKNSDGVYTIKEITPYSIAEETKLQAGDAILEIDARSLSELSFDEVNELLTKKWDSGSTIFITFEHQGTKDILSLKRKPE